jgi:flagellar biosynthesis protein FlhF
VEPTPTQKVPNTLFHLFSDLIEADVDEDFAKEVIDELQRHASPTQLEDANYLRKRASEWISGKVTVAPEIRAYPGQRRVVALIGPTGVGKTTTIAKLAANLRLRDKRRVGLITVDTYRIAAVDQLQAYADIIDLPMEVVSTPREMRNAVNRLSGVEIVLIDTAGRSPRDEIQLQELKSMLSEARPDEVHLVLSSVSSGRHLTRLVEQFTPVSPTSLVLTKLDESMTYGHLLPVACSGKLPLSYTTHGQNVPDDIQPASAATLVESVI